MKRAQPPILSQLLMTKVKGFLSQKNYPCTAAIQAFYKEELLIRDYGRMATPEATALLAQDLTAYLEKQNQNQLAKEQPFDTSWDPNFSSDPLSKNFCFSFSGNAFFVVGLHPQSNRKARRFQYPTMVFNLYAQFRELNKKGMYHPMINSIRARSIQFEGDVNLMVEKYGDDWESIQFSGRQNSPDWKCPFNHGK